MTGVGELPQCRLDVIPATLVVEPSTEQLGDEGAPSPGPDPPVELGHEVVVERNVQSHVLNIAHGLLESGWPANIRRRRTDARRSRMIIVSGAIEVDEFERDAYLIGCREVIVAARQASGCLDFHLSADPIEPCRINVYEQWVSAEAVEAFRGSGPSSDQAAAIRNARVSQHEIASSTAL